MSRHTHNKKHIFRSLFAGLVLAAGSVVGTGCEEGVDVMDAEGKSMAGVSEMNGIETYISFDGPYEKTFPAKDGVQITGSSEIQNDTLLFTNDWSSNTPMNDGHSFYFSGVNNPDMYDNDWAKIEDNDVMELGTKNFSIDFYVKTSSQKTINTVIDKRNSASEKTGYHVALYNGKPLLQLACKGVGYLNYYPTSNSSALNDGKWHQVSITVDRDSKTGGKITIDNSLVHTFNPTKFKNANISNDTDFLIGSHTVNGSFHFEGYLDEMYITTNQ